jgi:hypothetical protein
MQPEPDAKALDTSPGATRGFFTSFFVTNLLRLLAVVVGFIYWEYYQPIFRINVLNRSDRADIL